VPRQPSGTPGKLEGTVVGREDTGRALPHTVTAALTSVGFPIRLVQPQQDRSTRGLTIDEHDSADADDG
jgi:hypothetical protein